ncbi:hypothetical protein LPS07_09265 [Acinetobacter pittii]|nr:hypothetical protein [Acinetobacter pittii]UFN55277.1 hypothetical protein LPS07_09265 [Acinetobacter pittii]
MNDKIFKLIIDISGWVATLTIIFFFSTLLLFSHNNINEPLKESWSLSINFFASIGTLSAVFVAIYAFYFQALQSEPVLELKIQSIHSTNDKNLGRSVHNINISIINIGGTAILFTPKLHFTGKLGDSLFSVQPEYGYDIIQNLEQNKDKNLIITIHNNLDANLHEIIKELKLNLELVYKDKLQNNFSKKFKVISKLNSQNKDFLYLIKKHPKVLF